MNGSTSKSNFSGLIGAFVGLGLGILLSAVIWDVFRYAISGIIGAAVGYWIGSSLSKK